MTNIADRKSRQMLHKAKKMNPNAIVAAAGCYVQTGEEKLQADSCVDIIIGNNQKKNIVEALAEFEEARGQQAHIIKINQTKEYEELSIAKTAEHVRAYIKVQDGCNQFCTYCIIPYARGRVRSREPQQVLEEVRNLAKKGYKEVVLTGIHLSSYGVDFGSDKKETLLSLIQKVHQVEGIQRIRLGSLEPGIVTRRICAGDCGTSQGLSTFSSVPAERLRQYPGEDEPSLPFRGVQRALRASSPVLRQSCADHRCDRGLPQGERGGVRGFLRICKKHSFL